MFSLLSFVHQGEWGATSKELEAEEERRKQFIVICIGHHERRFIVLQEVYEVSQ